MHNLYKQFALVITLAVSSASALALPFMSFDPRSMAMGGTGVAVGDPASAPLFNPAMLSASHRKKKPSVEFPIIGFNFYDPAKLGSTNLTALNSDISALESAISKISATSTAADFATITTKVNTVNTLLSSLSGQVLQGDLGAATVISIPDRDFGVAFYAAAWANIGGALEYNDATTLSNFLTTTAACTANPAGAGCSTLAMPTLASKLHMRGVAVNEAGLSLSSGFVTNDRSLSVGITPKIMQLAMYDASLDASAGNISGMSGTDYQAKYTNLNVDLGMAKVYTTGWRSGLVVKNAIPYTYDFKSAPTPGATPVNTGATMTIRPQVRAGMAFQNDWSTLAFDADLTKNDPVGLENYSQYAALGIEINYSNLTQFRFGARNDMLNKTTHNTISAGLGISSKIPYFRPHFDLAITASPNLLSDGIDNINELGLSLRFGFLF
jgi:hypothetical protein